MASVVETEEVNRPVMVLQAKTGKQAGVTLSGDGVKVFVFLGQENLPVILLDFLL